MSKKPLVAVWRDAVRDSELDRTAKTVAWCLSTYLNAHGLGWPSVGLLADGASMTPRAVGMALRRLEAAGYLAVEWSRGRSSHRFSATLPLTANAVRGSEWATAAGTPNGTASNPERDALNPERGSQEDVEDVESGAHARGRRAGAALALDECMACSERRALHEWRDRLVCLDCVHDETGALADRLRAHIADLRAAV